MVRHEIGVPLIDFKATGSYSLKTWSSGEGVSCKVQGLGPSLDWLGLC